MHGHCSYDHTMIIMVQATKTKNSLVDWKRASNTGKGGCE